MKVIVAGLSKTGTKSMQVALMQLGYNVYDFSENFMYLKKDWEKILLDGGSTDDFRQMFENVDAVTDLPGCYFWDEIHKAFPESKIVLTMRDNEEEWSRSFQTQLEVEKSLSFMLFTYLSPTLRSAVNFGNIISTSAFGTTFPRGLFGLRYSVLHLKMKYRRHNSHVLHSAPKDKLLVFNVKEGWEPLCKFLGVDVPDKPFPHKNIAGNIMKEVMEKDPMFIRAKKEMAVSCSLIMILGAYGIYKFANRATIRCVGSAFTSFMSKLFS